MKTTYFLLAFVFGFVFQSAMAQQPGGMVRGSRGYIPPPKHLNRTYIELKDPQEELKIILPQVTAEFNMDAFQQEIFKSLLVSKIEDENTILSNKGLNRDGRKEMLTLRNNQFFKDLASILTTEEVEAYKNMDFTLTKEEKKDRKKKSKKKKNKA